MLKIVHSFPGMTSSIDQQSFFFKGVGVLCCCCCCCCHCPLPHEREVRNKNCSICGRYLARERGATGETTARHRRDHGGVHVVCFVFWGEMFLPGHQQHRCPQSPIAIHNNTNTSESTRAHTTPTNITPTTTTDINTTTTTTPITNTNNATHSGPR